MRVIALGSDHAGFPLKQDLKAWLTAQGHHVLDFGTDSPDAVDYPDFAVRVAEAVGAGAAERGVLVCGGQSSNDMAMSDPSCRWISIASLGPRKRRVPSRCERNSTPCALIFRILARLKTWKPPLSVRMG